MVTVTVQAIVDEARQLHIVVPDELPLGPVEVLITTLPVAPRPIPGAELTREQARAILLEAGLLSTAYHAPPNAVRLTAEEEEELGRLYGGEPDMATLISQDREERWD